VLRDYPKAIEYYERALQLSEKEGNQQNVAGNLSNLGNVYTQQKDFARALEYKQRALQLYEKLGNQSGVATNLGNIGNVYRQMEDILPEEVAEELKVQGQTMARHFESVTVLFTDFVNFTQKSEELGPQELVNTLHRHFRVFDDIMEKFGLEKIKTIGDAYMAVSGLPVPCADHAQRAAKAALEIRDYIQRNLENDPSDFQIRIGMHSGPVVAGIVGVKKFAYDVWGDTVNTAARMEHGSEPGKINVSGITCGLLGDTFVFESRGTIEAKHKGALEMFFLLK
ncbi:MAG: tetratricopeptide repeat protein, partial [Saprospiraceae bacterium]|nr:tetratricopeptide repeat protein [Saprospiraceae bacterium]